MKLPYWVRRTWLHLRAGKCSGFPACCIVFYSTIWQAVYRFERFSGWYHRKSGRAGYVPCPLCIISGARVRVNRCTELCGHVAESQTLTLERHPDAEFF